MTTTRHPFDPGPVGQPFAKLCEEYPGADVYPAKAFRVEWGPIFHRGRLDGTARVVVIGQDPAQHESIARRILVGEAGQRFQGFLAKLGIDTSYIMINTFLYSVYGQGGGEAHKDDAGIIEYRNRWLDALITPKVEAIVALGSLADRAYDQWTKGSTSTATGRATDANADVKFVHVTHPTFPDSVSASGELSFGAAMKRLLTNWNKALDALHPFVKHPDTTRPLVKYGTSMKAADLAAIPERDLPAGLPTWMRSLEPWADRIGKNREDKRATIQVKIPEQERPWK